MNKQIRRPLIIETQKKSVDELLRGFSSGISYRALEPRIAFDAAAVATAAATSDATQHQAADAGSKQAGDATPSAVSDGRDAHDVNADSAQAHGAQNEHSSDAFADAIMATDAAHEDAPVTIVFIDRAVENIDQIISSTDPSWEIVMIDENSSGLGQMASYLSGRTDVGSIHVVSHGEAGTLYIGNDTLTNANLSNFQAQLTAIGQALSDDGDILLYGCDVAAGDGGMDLVRAFSNYTGADIAASVNRTGGMESGGDWVLEATYGTIEAKALENPLYAGILTKTNTGAWAISGATATNTTDGITTTVTFTNGGSGTFSSIANDTFATATAANGLTAATFDNNGLGAASLNLVWNTTNTTDVGTVTVTFSSAVTNPVISMDKIGGVSGNGQSNSSVWTLATPGATLTRVSGVGHFVVDSAAGTIQRTVGVATASVGDADSNSAEGTAAGSVRVNGTFTTLTFTVRAEVGPGGNTSGEGMEIAFVIDAPPTAVADTFTTVHDTPVTIDVRANDTDPRGDTLTVTKVNGTAITAGGAGVAVTGGTVTLVSGNLVFTPATNYAGSPSFTYTVADPNGGESTATVSGTVTNIAPTIDLNSGLVTKDIITNGSDPSGAGWTRTNGTTGTVLGQWGWNTDGSTGSLRQTGLSGWNMGPGVHGAGTLSFDFRWNNGIPDSAVPATLIVSVGGTTYATITTGVAGSSANIATIQYQNGASGPNTTFVASTTVMQNILLNLPTTVSPTGDLLFSYATASGGRDDLFIDNISASVYEDETPGNNFSTTFNENGAPVSISDTDSSIRDFDDTNMESALVTLTNQQTGDRLLVNGSAASNGTIGTIAWTRTNTTVTFSGTATTAQYIAAIRQVQFENTTDTPSTTPRIINTIVNDGTVNSNTAVTTIAINRAPDPTDDAFSGNEDTAISANVLTNDTDVGDGPGSSPPLSIVTNPANGVLTSFNTTTGAFVYTPNLNYNGTDTFTYRYTDVDGDSKVATVTLTINPVNDAPVNTVPAAQTTLEDTNVVFSAANGNAIAIVDVDSNVTTTLSVLNGSLTLGTVAGVTVTGNGTGTVTVAGSPAAVTAALNGLRFAPTADWNGTTTLNVSTTDGVAPAVASTVGITVTPVADIVNDAVTTNEDTVVSFNVITGVNEVSGADNFENTPSVTAINGAAYTAGTPITITGGEITVQANGTVTFNPALNYNGTTSFTYTVTSGGVTETATVNITVNPVNDAPVNTVPAAQTTLEDSNVVFSAANGNAIAIVDVDSNVTTTLSVLNGSLTLGTVAGVTVTGNGTGTVTVAGSPAAVTAALNGLRFAPTADWNGTTTLNVSTTDGVAPAVASTVGITVTPVADIVNDAVTTNEDTVVSFNVITGVNEVSGADNFENTPSVTAINGAAYTAGTPITITGGEITVQANGTVTFNPALNYNGTTSFTYTVTSGGVTETATVNITVNPVNDAPVNTVPAAQTTLEDTNVVFSAANGNAIAIVDVDSNVTTTLSVLNGSLTLGTVAGVTVTGNGTGTVTVAGSPAAVTAALNGLRFAPTADWNGTTTLNVSTTDGVAPAVASTVGITVTPVADIVNDAVTTNEDTVVSFNVITGVNEVSGADNFENTPSVTAINGAAYTAGTPITITGGEITVQANGTVTFNPALNYNGTTSFTYTVTSGGVTETATVNITVNPVNDAPVNTVPAAQTTLEDTNVVFSAANGNAIAIVDVDSNVTTTLSVLNGSLTLGTVAGVTVTGNGTGTVTVAGSPAAVTAALNGLRFAPTADWNGTTTLNVSTTDGVAPAVASTVGITVTPVADIVNDAVTTNEDTVVSFNVITGVNEVSGADNFENTPSVTAINGAAYTAGTPITITGGEITVQANGTVTFNPALNYNGTTSFTYTVTSGGVTETATVNITVNPVNDAPVNTVPAAQTTLEDTNVVFSAANGNAIAIVDVDSNVTTTLSVLNGSLTLGTVAGVTVTGNGTGTVTVAGSPAAVTTALNGLRFAPTADWNGTTTLNVSTTDGVAPAVASTVGITVTPVADIVNDAVTTNEDTVVSFNVITGVNEVSGADNFENTPSVTAINGAAYTAGTPITITGGQITVQANGTVTFNPALNYNGTTSFTYTVTSGGVTETATVNITVNPVNDAPVNTVPAAQTTLEDTNVVFSAANGNAIAIVDVDSNVTTTLSVLNGSLTLGTVAGVTVTGNGTGTVTVAGSPAAVTTALNGLRFAPTADWNGTTTLNVSTTDGVAPAVASTVGITVTPVADIVNDAVTTNEDTVVSFNVITGVNEVSGADNFENTPSVTAINGAAYTAGTPITITGGEITVQANGTVTFNPALNYNGTTSFTYTVTSGGVTETATVNITVNPVNDAPVNTVPAAQTTLEDTNVVFSAANGNAIAIVDVDSNVTTTLSVLNGSLTLGTVAGVTVTGNGTGTVTVAGSPAAVTAALNGLRFAPTADWNGTTTLNVSTTDGVAPAVASTVGITVTPVADIVNDAVTTNEDTVVSFNVITGVNEVSGADNFENTPSVTAINGAAYTAGTPITITGGEITVQANGTVTFNPALNYNGTTSFTYTVTSGGVTETATVNITVNPVNDAPVNTVPAAQTTLEDTNVVFSAANGNAIAIVDVDSNVTTTLSVLNGSLTLGTVAGVTVTGNGTGTVTVAGSPAAVTTALNGLRFAPTADWNGTTTLNVSTTDGVAPAVASTVGITVTPVADIVNDAVTTNEDTVVSFNVITGVNEVSGADNFENTPSVTAINGAAYTAGTPITITGGEITVQANGTVTFNPALNYNGTTSFTYTVTSGGVTETATVNITVNPVNDAPVNTVPAAQTTLEDSNVVFSAANGNAIAIVDVDSNVTTTLSVLNGSLTLGTVAGVTVTGNGTGTVTVAGSPAAVTAALNGLRFAPTADWNGTTTLNVSTTDGVAPAVASTVGITVTPVADIVNDAVTTNEDTVVSFNVITGVNEVSGADNFENTPSVTAINGAAYTAGTPITITGGEITVQANGTVTFNPALNYNGTTSFTYTVTSGGVTETATVNITVNPVNDAPVAQNDTGTIAEDTTLTVPAATGLLSNDSDVDGNPLSITEFTVAGVPGTFTAGSPAVIPGVGTLTINTDGSYTFSPVANYNGAVPVATYTVSDNDGGLDTATLSIAVTAVNDAPVAQNDTGTVNEDTTLTVPAATGLLSNDSDVDGNPLSITQFTVAGVPGTFTAGSPAVIPGVGTLTINADGSYTFTPVANYNGAVPVATYTVSDNDGGLATATLSIAVTAVNDAPVAQNDTGTIAEDTTLTVPAATGLLSNDSDVDGNPLSITQFTVAGVPGTFTAGSPAVIPGVGTLTINADGSYTFTPVANYNGAVPVATYTVSDNDGGLATATLSIAVTAVNDAPVAQNDTGTVNEDTTLTVPAATGLLSNDSDVDGNPLSITQFTVAGVPGTFTAGSPAVIPGVGTLTINSDGSYTFSPVANYNGAVPVATYTVSDNDGGLATATLSIAVTAVNDAPVAQNDTGTVNEDTTLTVPAATGLLSNDSDVDGNPLSITEFTVAGVPGTFTAGSPAVIPGVGTLTINADGSYTFTPVANYNGAVPVATYTVSDNDGGLATATLSIAVTAVNDAPVAQNDTGTVNEDTTLTVPAATGLLSNDSDVDGNPLSITQFTVAGVPGTFTAGSPAVIPSVGTLTINADGSYTFTPVANYNGAVPVATYTVSDNDGGLDTATLSIAVTAVNDAPVAQNDTGTIAEDTTLTVPAATGLLSNDSDVDGNPLSITQFTVAGVPGTFTAGSPAVIPSVGTLTINADGSYTFTPVANYNGAVPVATYTVSDNDGGLDTATLSIAVTAVNDAPVAQNDTGTVNEDTTLTVPAATGLLSNDSDVDGNPLSITQFTVAGVPGTFTAGSPAVIPSVGTLTINADGSYTFTPVANYNGAVPVATYTVSDNDGGLATATLSIAVTAVNDAPVAQNDTGTVNEDTTLTVPAATGLLSNDSDVDGNPLSITQFTVAGVPGTFTAGSPAVIPSVGTLTINADGSYTFTPVANYNGAVPVATYTVSDNDGGLATATLSIAVTAVNDAPVAVDDVISGNEDTVITGNVTPGTVGQDSDVDGDTITVVDADGDASNGISPVSGPANGTLVLNADGTFSYRPNVNFNGTDSFSYRISDGVGGFAEATVFITVNPVNDAPVAADGSATTPEDTAHHGTLPPASDVDGDPVTYMKAADPLHGTVVVNSDGTYVYTPSPNYNGTDTFSYSVNDGEGGVSTYTVTVVVTPVDEPIVVTDIIAPPSKDSGVINFDLSKFVTDAEGDPLHYTAIGLPPGLTIDPVTGVVTGKLTKDASQGGPYTVTLTVDDGRGATTTTFTWPVENPAPIAVDDVATVGIGREVTVNVLANDYDPDGDTITVTRAQAANGSVQVRPDGSIHYVPKPGFVGQDRITYVISDGNGGTAIASVTVTVTNDVYDDKPPKFGFNGPGESDPMDGVPVIAPTSPGISADGAVVDAVFDIGMLRSVAGQLGANGAVLAAANGLRSLDGIASVGATGVILETVRAERAREILFNAGFDRNFQEYRIEGLPGFSLRNNVPGNLGGLSAREQVVIESLVRQDTLIVQLSNTIESGAKRIVDYRITKADGTPLPPWLDHVAKDLLIGRRDAGFEQLDLRVEAIYSDRMVVVELVRIDASTGEIRPLQSADAGTAAPRLFGDQFNVPSQLTPEEIQGLSKVIAR